MAHMSHGKAERILKFKDKETIINEDVIRKLFHNPHVKDRKIISFSVIGPFRKGKSYLLDYCLRYLYANYPSVNYLDNPLKDSENWMGDEYEALEGFSWRAGTERDTMGILVWNDIFLHTDKKTGEELAIVVMDTQGLFDHDTTAENNKRIFALSTLISSQQVLNLSGIIQEDHLQYLHFASEFAKFTLRDHHNASKPFQNLVFLVRDWDNASEFPFNPTGGKKYLEKVLKIKESKNDELKTVRKFITSSFEDLSCFFLPYPGKVVTGVKKINNTQYNGNWHDMDEDFREELFKLVEHLLSPGNLIIKKINDTELDGSNYYEYLNQYFKIFQNENFPKTETFYELTVEHQLNMLTAHCIERYKKSLQSKSDSINTILEISLIHEASKNEVLLIFKESKKMGNVEHEMKHKAALEDQIDKIYCEWKDQIETNLIKIEEEKEKTRKAEEEKQRLLNEKQKLEKEALKAKTEKDKLKYDFELKKTKLTNQMEMDKFKFQAENEHQASKNQYELEKLRLKDEFEREKLKMQSEVNMHKLEHEHLVEIAKTNVEIERVKANAGHQIDEQASKARYDELEKSYELEKLKIEKASAEAARQGEQDKLALKMSMDIEKIRIEGENQKALNEKDKEIFKVEMRAKDQIFLERSSFMQQQNNDMAQRLESAEKKIKESEKNDGISLKDIAEVVVPFVPVVGTIAKGLLKRKK